jgi:hypothetical protein
VQGDEFKVAFNLIKANKGAKAAGKADLIIGDIASLIITGGVEQVAVRSSKTLQEVLDADDFTAGYVEFDVPALNAGDYTMTKIIQDAQGNQKFASEAMNFSATDPVEKINSNGGSTGLLSLITLFGLGFLRRKTDK